MCAEVAPWEFGWEALVALATIGLAVATVTLAWSTRGVAQATQAELSASWRPVLTLVDPTWQDRRPWTPVPGVQYMPGDSRALVMTEDRIKLTVVNTGRGPAIGVHIAFDLSDEFAWVEPDGRAVAASEPAVFDITRREHRTFPSGVSGVIRYEDLAETTYETHFEIAQHRTNGASVLRQLTRRVQ